MHISKVSLVNLENIQQQIMRIINSIRQKLNPYSVRIFLFFSIGVIAVAPFVFTHFHSSIDFTMSTGSNIGSTIGGITAPFVGILAAYLVYQSFEKQREANNMTNEIVKRSIKISFYEEIVKQIEFTNSQFDSIQLKDKQGINAFYSLKKDLNNANEEFINQFLLLLNSIEFMTNSVIEFPRDRNRDIDNFNYYRSLELKVSYFILAKYSQIKDIQIENILDDEIKKTIISTTDKINKKLPNFL